MGVFEKVEGNIISVCKITFGAQPKDIEVYNLLLNGYHKLLFSCDEKNMETKKIFNPKRMQREIRKQRKQRGIETKSQQIIKKQIEEKKLFQKITNKKKTEAIKLKKYEMKQLKKKEKHKGH